MSEVAFPETADIETSSADYATRFRGEVGAWFLAEQAAAMRDLLRPLPAGARVLDVGGGHAQLTPVLVESGYDVTVAGSSDTCAERLAPWLGASCRFEVANVVALPFADRAFDAVVSVRLLPHVTAWQAVVGELGRVAEHMVVVDYPSKRSVNVIAEMLFAAKKRVEKNTRPFTSFHPREMTEAFRALGFSRFDARPQFLWPMVLHRMIGSAAVARALEGPGRALGLTRALGSPVILRASRT